MGTELPGANGVLTGTRSVLVIDDRLDEDTPHGGLPMCRCEQYATPGHGQI